MSQSRELKIHNTRRQYDIGNRLSRADLIQLKANEEMTIARKYIEEERLMQNKGDATCKIKNSKNV